MDDDDGDGDAAVVHVYSVSNWFCAKYSKTKDDEILFDAVPKAQNTNKKNRKLEWNGSNKNLNDDETIEVWSLWSSRKLDSSK